MSESHESFVCDNVVQKSWQLLCSGEIFLGNWKLNVETNDVAVIET